MKQLFIINEHSIGFKYGIGTYTSQLVQCVADDNEWKVSVVELFSPIVSELTIQNKNGIDYFQVPIPQYFGDESQYLKTNSRYYKAIFYILEPLIKSVNTIIHFNFVHGSELALLLKNIPTLKIVLTLHYTTWSFELLGNRERLQKLLLAPSSKSDEWIKGKFEQEKIFMEKCCDQVIAIARHSKEMIQTLYGIDIGKIVHISNGIKDEFIKVSKKQKIQIRKKFNFREDENLIIFAGRLETVKGIFVLIDAFKLLLQHQPNTKLIIAGDGAFTKSLSASNPIWQNIMLIGFVEKKQLYELFSICDIGVVPSIYEEFGLVAIEMMMNSLPLILGKTTGLDEIVDNESAIKVKINADSKECVLDLVNSINRLLENKTEAKKLAKKARRHFLRYYNLNMFEQKMKTQYNQLV